MTNAYPSVLIVDDNVKIGKLVIEIFNRLGFESVDAVSTVEEALVAVQEKSYGLIVSDLDLSPTDGIQLLKHIKSDEKLYQIAFILTETSITFDQVTSAYFFGVDAFLLKPFDITLLKSKLKTVLRRSAPRKRIVPDWVGKEMSDVA